MRKVAVQELSQTNLGLLKAPLRQSVTNETAAWLKRCVRKHRYDKGGPSISSYYDLSNRGKPQALPHPARAGLCPAGCVCSFWLINAWATRINVNRPRKKVSCPIIYGLNILDRPHFEFTYNQNVIATR
uniref:Uncharacterized protein n=1 Tax=Mesocestoides corti TaxID=53468 RepID=A0A5K3EKB7_MESCO